MKNLIVLLCCMVCLSFTQSSPDLTFLYQTWSQNGWDFKIGNPIFTYKPGKELSHNYGYQFREDGTLSASQIAILDFENFQFVFEVVEGNWKISEDSIIQISYSSGYKKNETLILKQLSEHELVVSAP